MKKDLNQLLALLAFVCICPAATAQDDSLYLNLGRVKLRKDFTQQVTVKARDLEQMPFASLTDAIKPWLQGTLTGEAGLVYVIDGNMVNDVDAWSVYDIDEITLVQNAAIQVNGALRNQQLVLVKTKRKETGKDGIQVAGGSALVNRERPDEPGFRSEANFYHQYHITAWQNRKDIQYGVSANYLRDVSPTTPDNFTKIRSPLQANRFRFNGWTNWQIAEGHLLTAQLNYSPQVIKQDYSRSAPTGRDFEYKSRQSILNPSLRLSNRIADGFTSEFDISYVSARAPSNTILYEVVTNNSNWFETYTAGTYNFKNLLVRERINYKKQFGNLQVEPSIAFTFRSLDIEKKIIQDSYQRIINDYGDQEIRASSGAWVTQSGEIYTFTPSLAFSFRNSIYVQGGISANLKDENFLYGDGPFPFVSLAVDVLQIINPKSKYSLKLFGSYTKATDFADVPYVQGDATNTWDLVPGIGVAPGNIQYVGYGGKRRHNDAQAGFTFSSLAQRLVLNYNYDTRKYLDGILFNMAGYGNNYTFLPSTFTGISHRLGLNLLAVKEEIVHWATGINMTASKFKSEGPPLASPFIAGVFFNAGKTLFTGGWVNRVQLKNIYFGLDILYLLNEQRHPQLNKYESVDSWRINNVYAGYRLIVARNKPLEVYISSRNCLEAGRSNLPDNRRHYGAGFRLDL